MKTAKLLLRAIAWCVGSIIRTTFALIVIAGLAFANYNMTIPGTGTLFGSIVVSNVHYAQMLMCDPTTPANCGAVKTASTAATTDIAQVVSDPVVASALNSATVAGTNRIGYVSDDPCTQKTKLNAPISTISGNVQLVAPSGTTKVYVCSLVTVGGTASIQNLIEGTGAACTTANEAAIIGSTTAANGMSFAANGGFAYGNGGAEVGVTATAGNGVCLLQSGTAQISGNITYVQQ
jgi:hypothetical protein